MPKAKIHPNQLGFVFEAPKPVTEEAALAGFEQRVNRMVGSMLNSDGRSREVIAAEMSVLLAETISVDMLNAYASPARIEHKVPFSRLMALVVVTKRYDLLDARMRETGCGVLVGEELNTARIGHIDQQIRKLQAEKRSLSGDAPLIGGDRDA